MTKRTLIKVGRSSEMDVQVNHQTVSRYHLEIVITDDGHLFITDCASSTGTYLKSQDGWKSISQEFAEPEQPLRLGSYQTNCTKLTTHRSGTGDDEVHRKQNGNADIGLPRGSVRRNPLTGDIESP